MDPNRRTVETSNSRQAVIYQQNQNAVSKQDVHSFSNAQAVKMRSDQEQLKQLLCKQHTVLCDSLHQIMSDLNVEPNIADETVLKVNLQADQMNQNLQLAQKDTLKKGFQRKDHGKFQTLKHQIIKKHQIKNQHKYKCYFGNEKQKGTPNDSETPEDDSLEVEKRKIDQIYQQKLQLQNFSHKHSNDLQTNSPLEKYSSNIQYQKSHRKDDQKTQNGQIQSANHLKNIIQDSTNSILVNQNDLNFVSKPLIKKVQDAPQNQIGKLRHQSAEQKHKKDWQKPPMYGYKANLSEKLHYFRHSSISPSDHGIAASSVTSSYHRYLNEQKEKLAEQRHRMKKLTKRATLVLNNQGDPEQTQGKENSSSDSFLSKGSQKSSPQRQQNHKSVSPFKSFKHEGQQERQDPEMTFKYIMNELIQLFILEQQAKYELSNKAYEILNKCFSCAEKYYEEEIPIQDPIRYQTLLIVLKAVMYSNGSAQEGRRVATTQVIQKTHLDVIMKRLFSEESNQKYLSYEQFLRRFKSKLNSKQYRILNSPVSSSHSHSNSKKGGQNSRHKYQRTLDQTRELFMLWIEVDYYEKMVKRMLRSKPFLVQKLVAECADMKPIISGKHQTKKLIDDEGRVLGEKDSQNGSGEDGQGTQGQSSPQLTYFFDINLLEGYFLDLKNNSRTSHDTKLKSPRDNSSEEDNSSTRLLSPLQKLKFDLFFRTLIGNEMRVEQFLEWFRDSSDIYEEDLYNK